jgi:hypothetical protein
VIRGSQPPPDARGEPGGDGRDGIVVEGRAERLEVRGQNAALRAPAQVGFDESPLARVDLSVDHRGDQLVGMRLPVVHEVCPSMQPRSPSRARASRERTVPSASPSMRAISS